MDNNNKVIPVIRFRWREIKKSEAYYMAKWRFAMLLNNLYYVGMPVTSLELIDIAKMVEHNREL